MFDLTLKWSLGNERTRHALRRWSFHQGDDLDIILVVNFSQRQDSLFVLKCALLTASLMACLLDMHLSPYHNHMLCLAARQPPLLSLASNSSTNCNPLQPPRTVSNEQ